MLSVCLLRLHWLPKRCKGADTSRGMGFCTLLECSLAREGPGDMGIMYGKGRRLALACDMLGERVGVSASVLSSALAPSKHVFLSRSA